MLCLLGPGKAAHSRASELLGDTAQEPGTAGFKK